MGPLAQANGHNEPGLVNQPVPSRAAVRDSEVIEWKACGAAQGTHDRPLLTEAFQDSLCGRLERCWPSVGPRLRHVRMVSVDTP